MARTVYGGPTRVLWLPSLADPSAPTEEELAAAIELPVADIVVRLSPRESAITGNLWRSIGHQESGAPWARMTFTLVKRPETP